MCNCSRPSVPLFFGFRMLCRFAPSKDITKRAKPVVTNFRQPNGNIIPRRRRCSREHRAIPRRFQLIKFHFLPGKAAFATRPIPKPLANCLRPWPATHLRRGQFHRDRRREIRIQTPVESHGEHLPPPPVRVTSKSRGGEILG